VLLSAEMTALLSALIIAFCSGKQVLTTTPDPPIMESSKIFIFFILLMFV